MTRHTSDLPPYDAQRILTAPFPEKVRLVCRSWAAQVAPNPLAIVIAYWLKYLIFYVGGWACFVSFGGDYPGFTQIGDWAFRSDAFQKAILWSILYEIAGLGCSSGPMNARFKPPIGGYLYFLRPGTTKLPLFPGLPLIGGHRRNVLDVALHLANAAFLLRALLAPEIMPALLLPPLVLIPLLGVLDKTIYLAARAEHYLVALLGLWAAHADMLWLSTSKLVWCAIWFWAATSKLNHHFPSVIQVMVNNGPFFPSALKQRLFANYPEDLRPSKLAAAMAHTGTFTEYSIPVLLLATQGSELALPCLLLMTAFHGFISLNSPNGMPIEWNILMVYGGWFLFGQHPEASLMALTQAPLLTGVLCFSLFAVPAFGNFFPAHCSFLLSMRYYAGNWAYNIWLIRKDAVHKLKRLVKPAGTLREQLTSLLPDAEQVELALAHSLATRFMHFEGRVLLEALPLATPGIEQYEWHDGEVLGGSIIGWNFGDGHLNGAQLLAAVQAQCGFEPDEVRVVMVESQPLFGRTMQWRVVDAASGEVARGETRLAPMRTQPPWPSGAYAEAFARR